MGCQPRATASRTANKLRPPLAQGTTTAFRGQEILVRKRNQWDGDWLGGSLVPTAGWPFNGEVPACQPLQVAYNQRFFVK